MARERDVDRQRRRVADLHDARRRLDLHGERRPIPAAPAGGVLSLAFRNPRHGVMVGGDFMAEANGVDASGFTRSWTAFDSAHYDAVGCVPFTCWASGPEGAVAVLARR